jgi:hypothetical protein
MSNLDELLGAEAAQRFGACIRTPQVALITAMEGEVSALRLRLMSMKLEAANEDLDTYHKVLGVVISHFENLQTAAAERGDHFQSRAIRELITHLENLHEVLQDGRKRRDALVDPMEEPCKTNPSG